MNIRDYYSLIKPGIIYSNALTVAAGFFLAAHWPIRWFLLVESLAGIALVAASSCVVNNVIDRDIDAKMERTKGRALPSGRVSVRGALVFATVLLLVGIADLAYFTNYIAVLAALAGFGIYVCLYTPMKRRSMHAVHVGALAGAVPPVVGYAAMRGTLDIGAAALVLILFLWQIPHFFSIGLYRHEDYCAADLPIASVVLGVVRTRILILLYIALFSVAAFLPRLIGMTGTGYAVVMAALCLGWAVLAIKGFFLADHRRWARVMFFYSLIVIVGWSAAIIATHLLPTVQT